MDSEILITMGIALCPNIGAAINAEKTLRKMKITTTKSTIRISVILLRL